LFNISRLRNRDADPLSALLADDERVTESVSELLQLLRVRVGPYIADHSMATALWSASIARVMGLDRGGSVLLDTGAANISG